MLARWILAACSILILAVSAHAQYRNDERFPRRFHERGSMPAYMPERHSILPNRPAPPALPSDALVCDKPDADPDAAIAACGRIIAKGPTKFGYGPAVAHVHRGQAYEDKGDHALAIADFSDAIRIRPNAPVFFAMRGGAEDNAGDTDAARNDFHAAARLDPKNQDALNGLKRIETRSAVAVASTSPSPAASSATHATEPPASTSGAAAAAASTAVAASTAAATAAAHVVTSPTVTPPAVTTTAVTPPAATPATAVSAASNVAASNAVASNVARGGRVALVIGNGAYVNANQLPNPPNDARAIAGALREIGFDVIEGVNLDHAAMEKQFRDFLHKASNASIVLLFYAGHGMQVDGRNYLIPVDAKLAEPSDLPFETIEIDKLLDSLGDPGRTNIILLDACRDNPLARSFASHLPASRSAAVPSGLAAYSAVGTGTLIAYATAPGQTALDGQGADSPFTTSLLHNIRVPGLEIRQVLTRVRAEVAQATGNKQIPWDNSSLMGDVVLVKQEP